MAAITSLVLTDTFNTFITRVNGLISKLNTITADASTVTMAFHASEPSTSVADMANSTAIMYFDASDGKLKIKSKDSSGVVTAYALSTLDS